MTAPDADARLRALEREVAALAAEVGRLRADAAARTAATAADARGGPDVRAIDGAVGDAEGTRARGAPPRVPDASAAAFAHHRPPAGAGLPARPAPPPRAPSPFARLADRLAAGVDLEALVGRYGTLLLGALTVLLGVGAFLSWAVQRVELGPGARVLLGALAAVGVGALGLTLRARGTRRFGGVLLALALALVHVVAWGAGPTLGVVPPAVALAIAAAASAALAALAWRDADQPLFVVGVGGALLAPFVTAGDTGDPFALLSYGLVVLAAATAALRDRAWPWAVRVLVAATLLYTGVALDATTPQWEQGLAGASAALRRAAPAAFVLLAAWAALLLAGRHHRSALARRLLVVLAIPLAWRATAIVGDGALWDLVAAALAGAATVYVALRLRDAAQPWARASAALQPPLLLLAAVVALPTPAATLTAAVAAAFAALALLAAADAGAVGALAVPAARRTPTEPRWAVHVAVAVGALTLALSIALRDAPVAMVAALGGLAVAGAWVAHRGAVLAPYATVALALALAGLRAADLLDARPSYAYPPFLTPASLAALSAVIASWIVGRLAAARMEPRATTERALVAALGPAAAFGWGWAELVGAVAPDVAAFLVIAYFALVGVGLILLGRARRLPGGRRVGLGLAILAAFTAIAEASDFASVGLRVGSYLLVGGFLLAVAYWYRAAGDASDADEAMPPTPRDAVPAATTDAP